MYRKIIITLHEARGVSPLLEMHHYREILQMHLHTRLHSWTLALPRVRTRDVVPVCRLMLVLVRVVRHPPDEVEPRRVIRVAKGEVGGDKPTDASKRWGWMKSGTDRSSWLLPEKCALPGYVFNAVLVSVFQIHLPEHKYL